MASKNKYIDNAKFAEAMQEHRAKVDEAIARGESPRIPVSNYIGTCFYKIAVNLSLRPNFIGYSFRQEMVSDALENMLSNAHNFNPNAVTRSGKSNPFSYFTLLAWRTFVHRIKLERKQEYVKYKVTENEILMNGGLSVGESDDKMDSRNSIDLDSDYYQKLARQFEKPKKEKKTGLDKFLED